MCDGGTVEYLRDLVCHKEALQVEKGKQAKEKCRQIERKNILKLNHLALSLFVSSARSF